MDNSDSFHLMIVDRVSTALKYDPEEEDPNQDDDDLAISDEDMLNDEGSDDLMTLN